jgi:hypothetical protein
VFHLSGCYAEDRAPENLVKPHPRENPRQHRRFAWRIYPVQLSIIEDRSLSVLPFRDEGRAGKGNKYVGLDCGSMGGMSDLSREQHAALLAEMLIKHLSGMGLDHYETEPDHYGWAWKVTATRVKQSEQPDPLNVG